MAVLADIGSRGVLQRAQRAPERVMLVCMSFKCRIMSILTGGSSSFRCSSNLTFRDTILCSTLPALVSDNSLEDTGSFLKLAKVAMADFRRPSLEEFSSEMISCSLGEEQEEEVEVGGGLSLASAVVGLLLSRSLPIRTLQPGHRL